MALKDNQSNTILHQLAFEGHLDIMQLFVKEAKKRLHREKKRKLY
jgi:ankyrin repeat protein